MKTVQMPMTPGEARTLRAGDMVLLSGEIVTTAGLPTHHRLLACAEKGRAPQMAIGGGSLLHLGSYSQDTPAGGLDVACVAAMAEVGCVYFSFLGGGAPLHSSAIQAVREVACHDLVAHCRLVRLAVEGPEHDRSSRIDLVLQKLLNLQHEIRSH